MGFGGLESHSRGWISSLETSGFAGEFAGEALGEWDTGVSTCHVTLVCHAAPENATAEAREPFSPESAASKYDQLWTCDDAM
jgi:hypothetical protein